MSTAITVTPLPLSGSVRKGCGLTIEDFGHELLQAHCPCGVLGVLHPRTQADMRAERYVQMLYSRALLWAGCWRTKEEIGGSPCVCGFLPSEHFEDVGDRSKADCAVHALRSGQEPVVVADEDSDVFDV